MAEVTWFKVLTDIFADDKIKIIQSMPEGDSLLVMWFKVLSQAGKTNDGGYIYLRKSIPYTPAMLATLFNKPQMIVELALKTFEQFEMLDIDENGYIFVTNWEKHQSIDKLSKIKENDRIRSANYRERKRLELQQNHVTVTLPSQPNHATDIEVDLELDKEKDTTITSAESFIFVLDAYCKLHNKSDFHMSEIERIQIRQLLADGINHEFIVETMKKAHKWKTDKNEKVTSFRYYPDLIADAWKKAIGGEQSEVNGRSYESGGYRGTSKKSAELSISDEEMDTIFAASNRRVSGM